MNDRCISRGCALAACVVSTWVSIAASSAARAADDIHEIRGPKALPVSAGMWTLLIAAGVLLGLGGAYLWHRHRSARPAILTLSEQALAALDEARSLMRAGSAREFGISTSEVIRSYIEKRFGVIATQRTTEEFLQSLLQDPDEALSRHRALLADFLQQCDIIKFAGTGGALAELESLLASARSFVLATQEPPAA